MYATQPAACKGGTGRLHPAFPRARPRCAHGAAEYANFRGPDNVTHEDIVREVKPQARAKVPDSLKAELLQNIKSVLMS
jgi:hypothetical protein